VKSEILKDKLIIVTGGAGLIGESFVREIVAHAGIPVVADIDLDKAKFVAQEINNNFGGRAEAIKLDITSKNSICSLINDLYERYDTIDAIINNAYPRNKNYGCKLEDVTYEDFCENVDMHLGGYFLVAQQFCLAFKKQGKGNIINMASIYGEMAPRFDMYEGTTMTMPVEYAAIKSSVVQLTRYFAQYFKGTGIRVNSLSPGGILDGQPINFLNAYNSNCSSKGMLDANDLYGSLLYLLSDMSTYVTGQNITVDDGFSL
jgi:NAD(P)-dependent dehydrogenase (short-subunit alcohol dehydrogenase family)